MRQIILVSLMIILLGALLPVPAHAAGIVGNGTPASCTRDAIAAALVGGGSVTFNCGASPVTIPITATLETSAASVTIDGGGLVTLQGVAGVRILRHFTFGFNAASTLTIRNITFANASISGVGSNSNGAAILSQNQSANFNTDIPTLNLENVTFTNNVTTTTTRDSGTDWYDFGGGAVFSLGGVVTISNSTFSANRANQGAGGAVHGLGSTITITGSTFTNNVATAVSTSDTNSGYGGALYIDGARFIGGGGITILNSSFNNNMGANQGGFAYINLYGNRSEFLTMQGVRVVGNSISGGGMGLGGGLSGGGTNGAVSVIIANSLFASNQASGGARGASGGGIAFAQAANILIGNTTFTGNRANGVCADCWNANGGALYVTNNPTPFQLINSTIAGNYAGWVGGGVAAASGVLRNTIFANNTADNGGNGWQIQQHCSALLTNQGGNIQFPDRNPNPNFWNEIVCATGIRIANPLLATSLSADGTLIPQAGSPAIDSGDNSVCAAPPINNIDQRGASRPQDGDTNGSAICDAGAHEVTAVTTSTLNGTVMLQGRTPGSAAMSVPISLDLYVGSTLAGVLPTTTDSSGRFTINGLQPGTYTARIKHGQYLAHAQTVTLAAGTNTVSFGTLLAGDVNNDNQVTLTDFSVIASMYNRTTGSAGYDGRADLNGNGAVTLVDFSLLAANFNRSGAAVP
jgi:hypothetical protein